MTTPDFTLRKLHERYEALTGRRYCYEQWERDWHEFSKFYSEDDLIMVITYANRINQQREAKYRQPITPLKLIADLRLFDSLRGEAEVDAKRIAAKKRQFQPSEGATQLAAMRHEPVQPPDEPAKRVTTQFVADAILKGNGRQ